VLMATARMPDPEDLPAATGDYRQALAILKEQAKRGIAQDASIGWRDDDEFPGGVDLMEASIVGIGADWRTNTGDDAAEVVARAAVEAGADPDTLAASVREIATEQRDRDADAPDDSQDNDMTDPNDDEPTDEQDADADTEADGDDTEQERDGAECPDCGYSIRDDANYCSDCGADLREDDEDGDGEDSEGDEEESDDEDDDRDTTPEEERDTDADADDDLRQEVESLREELNELREGGLSPDDVDTPETDGEQDADTDDEQSDDETRDTEGGDDFDNLGDYL